MAVELWRTDTQVSQNAEGKPEFVKVYGVAAGETYFVSVPVGIMQALIAAAGRYNEPNGTLTAERIP